jgi:transcriptional regulator with XRE-family HTH domain
MTKWDQLVVARKKLHLSQMEAAERVNVGIVTYQRWETGNAKPQPEHMRQLYAVFGTLLESAAAVHALEASDQKNMTGPLAGKDSSRTQQNSTSAERPGEPGAFIASHMTPCLWSLAFQHYPTGNSRREAIRQAIKEFDTMNTDNKNYQITRREALCSLATLPLITFGLTMPDKIVQSPQYSSVLAQCASSLEACWELYQNGDAGETALAFKCSSKYLSVLQAISKDSSKHRKEAIDLATHYALVKTLLGWICVGPTETIQYAKDAVALSKETENISLQLSAHSKLAWAYFYTRKYTLALNTAQQAKMLLQGYTQRSNVEPLHSCVYGGTYSTLALMQAKNGQSPDVALGKVAEIDPSDERYAFMTSRRSTLLLEAGWTYCYHDDQVKAMQVLEQRVDPETLTPRIAQSTMGRVETLNVMALSSLRAKDRDMERTIHFWATGITGARTLQNEQRFNEALTTYELMDTIWPGERRIADLRDYTAHW